MLSQPCAEIAAAQVGNVHHPQYPELEDFGDVMLRGDRGTGWTSTADDQARPFLAMELALRAERDANDSSGVISAK